MSLQSSLVKFLLRRSGMWNKPLPEIRSTMQSIKVKSFPGGIITADDVINSISCKTFFHKDSNNKKVIIYYHGGGYCLGIYASNARFAAEIARRTGMDVYMPDYRLAPENVYPAALEDGADFYQGILGKGHLPENIIILGDSSGCSLAAAALLLVNKKGVKMPGLLAFITPLFDLAGKGDTMLSRAHKDPFRLKDPLGLTKNYIGTNNPAMPSISPLYGELECLPPVIIHAADEDVFLSDSYRFQRKLLAMNKDVRLKVWKKLWHIFHMQYEAVPEANLALEELCSDIKRGLV